MRPSFQAVNQHYPRTTSREELFADIGWNNLANDPAYVNTCAVRMSYGLLRAGVSLPGGRMKAYTGALKGRYLEPGQAKLSNILKRLWGAPEVFSTEAAAFAGTRGRTGVVSFFQIGGTAGGHIDLIIPAPGGLFPDCARVCFWRSGSVWFWPLK